MAVTTHPLTGVFDADRMHSSFQFAVRRMKVSTVRVSLASCAQRSSCESSSTAATRVRHARSSPKNLAVRLVWGRT